MSTSYKQVPRGEGWKVCSCCRKFKLFNCYRKSSNGRDGHRGQCKRCENDLEMARRDPQVHAARARKYRAENRESCNEQHLAWRSKNRDRFNQIMRRAKLLRKADKNPELLVWLEAVLGDPCAYCGKPSDSLEHVDPVSRGGSNDSDNIVGACLDCNRRKSNKTLLEYLST